MRFQGIASEIRPPLGGICTFYPKDSREVKMGFTARLSDVGPLNSCETVIYCPQERKVYFMEDVYKWSATVV